MVREERHHHLDRATQDTQETASIGDEVDAAQGANEQHDREEEDPHEPGRVPSSVSFDCKQSLCQVNLGKGLRTLLAEIADRTPGRVLPHRRTSKNRNITQGFIGHMSRNPYKFSVSHHV